MCVDGRRGVLFSVLSGNVGDDGFDVNGYQDFFDVADKKEDHLVGRSRSFSGGASLSNQGSVQFTTMLRNGSYLNCSCTWLFRTTLATKINVRRIIRPTNVWIL